MDRIDYATSATDPMTIRFLGTPSMSPPTHWVGKGRLPYINHNPNSCPACATGNKPLSHVMVDVEDKQTGDKMEWLMPKKAYDEMVETLKHMSVSMRKNLVLGIRRRRDGTYRITVRGPIWARLHLWLSLRWIRSHYE